MPESPVASARPSPPGFDLIDAASIAVTAAAVVTVAANEHNAIRLTAGLIFVLFVPGRAVVSNWPAMATRSHFAVSVLFSLTILAFAATIMLWSDFWHPIGLFEVEAAFSIAALFTAIQRRRRTEGALHGVEVQIDQSQ